jgi:replicative DNA helicase
MLRSDMDMFVELNDLITMIRKSSSNPGLKCTLLPTLKTGFKILDHWTGGLAAGDLIILAGRPCTGKTIFALNIALQTALASGKDSLFFSLCSTREAILKNVFTVVTGIPASVGPVGNIEIKDLARMVDRCARLLDPEKIGSFFVHDEMYAIDEIEKEVLERKSNSQLGLVVIDCLQLCEHTGSRLERSDELIAISHSLRKLSKKTRVPIIVLSSVNTDVDARSYNKRPTLADINAPGEIVDDCDMVWMLYRDELYDRCDDNPHRGAVDLAILKNRRGKLNLIELRFVEEMQRFEDIASL